MADVTNKVGGAVFGNIVQAGHIDAVSLNTVSIDTVSLAAPPREALDGLPAEPADFVGRQDLLAALAGMLEPGAAPGPIVVSGLAGVGKTALAVCAGHAALRAGRFPGGTLFADLRGYDETPEDPAAVLGSFLRALGVSGEQVPADRGEAEARYRSALAEHERSCGAVLVLLDNASSAAQVRPLLPGTAAHRVVVTSRHRLGDLAGSRPLGLDVFSPDESGSLLRAVLDTAGRSDDRLDTEPGAARELAELCGRLPLALRIVAALLADDRAQPVGELAEALRDEARRLTELEYGDDLAVLAAFDLSYARLGAAERRLFRLLSLATGPHIGLGTAGDLAGLEEPEARRLVRALCRAHMLEHADKHGWVRFHDLLRLYATRKAAEEDSEQERDEAVDRMLAGLCLTLASASNEIQPTRVAPGAWEPPKLFSGPHAAMDWLEAERLGLVAAVELAYRTQRHDDVWRLSGVLFGFLGLTKRHQEMRHVLELALESSRQARNYEREGQILNNMALVFEDSPEEPTELLLRFYEALVTARGDLDADRECSLLLSIGIILHRAGRDATAATHFGAAMRVAAEAEDPGKMADALQWLGISYEDLGHTERAVECYHSALSLHREVGDRRGEAAVENFLALVLDRLERVDEALDHYSAALSIHRDMGDRHNEAEVLFYLGRTHQRAGSPAQARDCWTRALAVAEEIGYGKIMDSATHALAQE